MKNKMTKTLLATCIVASSSNVVAQESTHYAPSEDVSKVVRNVVFGPQDQRPEPPAKPAGYVEHERKVSPPPAERIRQKFTESKQSIDPQTHVETKVVNKNEDIGEKKVVVKEKPVVKTHPVDTSVNIENEITWITEEEDGKFKEEKKRVSPSRTQQVDVKAYSDSYKEHNAGKEKVVVKPNFETKVEKRENAVRIQPVENTVVPKSSVFEAKKGTKLSKVLSDWANQENWDLYWSAEDDFIIPTNIKMTGDIEYVFTKVGEALASEGIDYQIKLYRLNSTIVVK